VSDNEFAGWRKSSHSGTGNSCVEVATSVNPGEAGGDRAAGGARRVGVRDTTQNGRGPVLEFGAGAWTEFLAELKHGRRSLEPVERKPVGRPIRVRPADGNLPAVCASDLGKCGLVLSRVRTNN
jgi:hypothetical protein